LKFSITPAVRAAGIEAVVLAVRGMRNRASDADFEAEKTAALERILAGLGPDSLSSDPILRGYRDLHTRFGFSNRTFLASSEGLLGYALKQRRLPQINLVVDIYNLVSLETRLSLGAHDLDKLNGNVTLRLTDGSERFVPLGSPAPKPVRAGAYAYVDGANHVICLMEVKQGEGTRITPGTSSGLFIVQGNPAASAAQVRAAAQRLVELLGRYVGGEVAFLAGE